MLKSSSQKYTIDSAGRRSLPARPNPTADGSSNESRVLQANEGDQARCCAHQPPGRVPPDFSAYRGVRLSDQRQATSAHIIDRVGGGKRRRRMLSLSAECAHCYECARTEAHISLVDAHAECNRGTHH
jgi:hypothetical protein